MLEIHRSRNCAFQVAYMFTPRHREPTHTDTCTVFWRWMIRIIPYLILSCLFWITFGIIFGILGQFIGRFVLFLVVARKLEYCPVVRRRLGWTEFAGTLCEWVPGKTLLDGLNIFHYTTKTVSWLQWLPVFQMDIHRYGTRARDDVRVGPVPFFIALAFILGLGGIVIVCCVELAYYTCVYIYSADMTQHTYQIFSTGGLLIGGAAFLFLLWKLSSAGLRHFLRAESGQLFIQRWRDFKTKHCTLYTVVE